MRQLSFCIVSVCALPCLQPVLSSEHMAALGVFGLCQIHAFVDYLRSKLNPQQFEILFRSVISLVGFVLLTIGAVLMLTGSLRSPAGPTRGDDEHISLLALPPFDSFKSVQSVGHDFALFVCTVVSVPASSSLMWKMGLAPVCSLARKYLECSRKIWALGGVRCRETCRDSDLTGDAELMLQKLNADL